MGLSAYVSDLKEASIFLLFHMEESRIALYIK